MTKVEGNALVTCDEGTGFFLLYTDSGLLSHRCYFFAILFTEKIA